jgi:hypothetical protein
MSLWHVPQHPVWILPSQLATDSCLHVNIRREIAVHVVPFSPSSCYVPEVMKSNITIFTTSYDKRRNRTTSNVIIKNGNGAGTTFTKSCTHRVGTGVDERISGN